MVDYIYKDGIRFGEFDSIKEKLLLVDRDDTPPDEKEIKESIPYTHGELDFSRRLSQAFRSNRSLEYTFFINEENHERRKVLEIKYENMLLKQGFKHIFDTANPEYFFYGKCSNANVFYDNTWNRLKLVATFDCYPFMTSVRPEGHDIWDEFNFELDVAQQVKHNLTVTWNKFKELNVGDKATVAGWATQYHGGREISDYVIGATYTIEGKKEVNSSKSRWAYKIAGGDFWLLEQDVRQAQTEFLEFDLINAGVSVLRPTIKVNRKVTLLLDGFNYNLEAGTHSNLSMQLKPGVNQFKMYTTDGTATVEFEFHKELI